MPRRAVRAEHRKVRQGAVVERIVVSVCGRDGTLHQVGHPGPIPQNICDSMCVGHSLVEQPDCRTGAIHCMVLSNPAHRAAALQIGADIALPEPDSLDCVGGHHGCHDERTCVELHEQVVSDALGSISFFDGIQRAVPAIADQAGSKLRGGIFALARILPISPPTQTDTHLDPAIIGCGGRDELLHGSASHLPVI